MQKANDDLSLLKDFNKSVSEIEKNIEAIYLIKGGPHKDQYKTIITEEIERADFSGIYKIQKSYSHKTLTNPLPNNQHIKTLLSNIEIFLKKENESEVINGHYLNIAESINTLKTGVNNLIIRIVFDQQETVLMYKKTNILVWLGSLIIIHLLIIFLYRPMTKKITTEFGLLNQEKDDAIMASRTTAEFLATMSHEIRTPLNGVLGLTSLLLETRVSQEQHDYLDLVRDSGESLLQVVNNIFDYSNFESGVLKLDQMYFSLHTCVDEIVETFLPAAIEKNIQLLHLIEPDVPEHILGDYKRTVQCISNFVNNAIKYTRNGEVLIRINRLNATEGIYELQFSISDTGIGIPETKLKSLFTPFKSEKSPAAKRFEGIGLGLAINSKLVELMGGRIWVESEVNKGSTFYFAAHFQADENTSQIRTEKDITLLNEKHILILEANENVRKVLSVQCHNWGMYPNACSAVDELSQLFVNNKNIDVALLDLDLIERIDEGILETIKRRAKDKNIPVLLMRSTAKRKHNSEVFEDFAFIKKQVKQSQLYGFLINMIGKNQDKNIDNLPDKDKSILSLSLLLAEDNIINQKLMERFTSRIGYKIDIAQNGVQAVKMAAKTNYNMIFMDLQMPEMDGIEATRKILSSQTGQLKPKIIAMTANVKTEDKELCFDAGMVDYITKPVSFDKVKHLLNYWGKLSLQDRNI